MTKKNIMPVVVLVVICVIVAGILAVVNLITAPIIEKAEEQKVYDSFRVVLDGDFESAEVHAGAPKTVTALYKVTEDGSLKGHVVTLKTKGYAGDISITVGIDAEGKVTKAIVTNESESHGKSGMKNYTDRFTGANADMIASVETFTGATVSSSAIKGAIIDAVNFITGSTVEAPDTEGGEEETPETLPKTDDEIKAIGADMLEYAVELEDVYLYKAPSALKRLYSAGEQGYLAYIVVPGAYVPVATEAVVHLNRECEIVDVNLLSWIVGHDVTPGNWADSFDGTDKNTVGDVELVTGATGTSSDFRAALESSVSFIESNVERTEKSVLKYAAQLVPGAKEFEPVQLPEDAGSTLKLLYKPVGAPGYVAYVVTSTQYTDKETEALVYINTRYEVVDINLLTWTVGHGVEPGDFADGFIGKDADEISEVEIVTSATTTSENLKTAVSDALRAVGKDRTPMIVGIVIAAIAVVAATAAIIISKKRRAVK
ncbi:MAG: FMN-binding protein [Clostridia bacterium]|nr:FMN-binding protein [Clostridia bacterium]